MSAFPNSPRLLKGGIVLVDPDSGTVLRVIVLQYNPDTITRSLQIQTTGDGSDRAEILRLKGPPIETIKLEAEIDATDQLELGSQDPTTLNFGLQPALSALETIIYPSSTQLLNANALASAGTLEIAPMEAPLPLFVWSKTRIVPVKITDLSITEESFDPTLNPVRAKVSLGMRVLSVTDLGFEHRGGNIYMSYQKQKETLAGLAPVFGLNALGIGGIP